MVWMLIVLTLTLVLGLSIGGLIIGRQDIKENFARYFLIGLLGTTISAIIILLIVIAVWPPYNILSFIITLGFLGLLLGVICFVRITNTPDVNEGD